MATTSACLDSLLVAALLMELASQSSKRINKDMSHLSEELSPMRKAELDQRNEDGQTAHTPRGSSPKLSTPVVKPQTEVLKQLSSMGRLVVCARNGAVQSTTNLGFATAATVREGHLEILEILVKAGASQPACEEALLEASYRGRARHVELLMGSDLIRPHIAVHSLVTACCRGFMDVVDALIKVIDKVQEETEPCGFEI